MVSNYLFSYSLVVSNYLFSYSLMVSNYLFSYSLIVRISNLHKFSMIYTYNLIFCIFSNDSKMIIKISRIMSGMIIFFKSRMIIFFKSRMIILKSWYLKDKV
jgi:hypothetical protein